MALPRLNPLPLWQPALNGATNEHRLELVSHDGEFEVLVSETGQIKIYQNSDAISIRNIDEFIERLQGLKEAVITHFGEGWPF